MRFVGMCWGGGGGVDLYRRLYMRLHGVWVKWCPHPDRKEARYYYTKSPVAFVPRTYLLQDRLSCLITLLKQHAVEPSKHGGVLYLGLGQMLPGSKSLYRPTNQTYKCLEASEAVPCDASVILS